MLNTKGENKMCNFYSCIIDQKGKIYDGIGLDSHSDIEQRFNLRDNNIVERAKIEVVPKNIWDSVDTWKFTIDEERTPTWWNEGYRAIVMEHIKQSVIDKYWKGDNKGNGVYERYYENGQLEVKTMNKNGKLYGVYENYYKNGQLTTKTTYKNDKCHGVYEIYYKNGQLEVKTMYKNGKYRGVCERYYENGQLATKTTYKNDECHGVYERYYENGQLAEKTTYKNGIEIK